MAFNPLHALRKQQKVVMAGLVLVAMITFVLSSGMSRGDAWSWLTDRAGGGGGGTTVLSVAGKDYSFGQVQPLRAERLLASRYMDYANSAVQNALAQKAQNGLAKLDVNTKQLVGQIVETRRYAFLP